MEHAFQIRLMFLVCAIACLIFATAVYADPPPAKPAYIAKLQPKVWVFGYLLWKGREPCVPDICEAGYYSAPLMLSVQVEPSIEENGDHKHVIQITAGIDADSTRTVAVRATFRS